MYPYRSKLQIVNSFTWSTFPSVTWFHAGRFNWLPGQTWHYSNCHPASAFIMHECLFFVPFQCIEKDVWSRWGEGWSCHLSREPEGAQAVIYSLAGHPLFSAESVMTCNHTQTFSVATLFVFLHFLKHRKPFFFLPFPSISSLCKDLRGVWFGAMDKISWNNINGNDMHMNQDLNN